MDNITLYREVNDRVRYYSLKLQPTLFGEHLFIIEYGNVKNKRPTRIIKEYYKIADEAISTFKSKLLEKQKRGYATKLD